MTDNIYLRMDNDSKLLTYYVSKNRYMILPLIRWLLLCSHNRDPEDAGKTQIVSKKLEFITLIKNVWFYCRYNPFLIKRKKIIIFSTAVSSNLLVDNKYFNRISDYFALERTEDTVLIERSLKWRYYFPRYFQSVYCNDFIKLVAILISKILPCSKPDLLNIDKFIEYVRENHFESSVKQSLSKVRSELLNLCRLIPVYEFFYRILFRRINPLVVFVEDGCYGGLNAIILKIAKEMNIITAEFQHGFIDSNDVAYNYADVILRSQEYGTYLPDYLLLYGLRWASSMNVHSKKIIIGNPNLSEMICFLSKEQTHKYINNKKNILFISQWTVSTLMAEYALKIIDILDNEFVITFRLHPAEEIQAVLLKKLKDKSILINKNESLYNLFHKADYIVGCYSTALFEAMAFKKAIYILDHPLSVSVPDNVGMRVKNPEELATLIKNNVKANNGEDDIKLYWADNWRDNYRAFLSDEIGLS